MSTSVCEEVMEGPVSVSVTAPSVPSAPTGPADDPDGGYTISWSSVTGASTYDLQERVDGGSWSTIHSAAGASKARSGLGNGSWQYQVRACSTAGCSSYSSAKTVIVALTPGVPASISVSPSPSYDGSHTVSWGASSGSVTEYRLERNFDSGGYSQIYAGASLSQNYSSLSDGSYLYRVRACKTVSTVTNCSGYRTLGSAATVSNLPSVPGTPAVSDGATSPDGDYTVSWTASSGTVTAYKLEEQVNTGSWTEVQSSMSLNKAFSSKADNNYSYRVRACNTNGCSSYSSVTTVTVLYPPGVPGSITAPSDDADGDYTVSWGSASGGGTITYTLQERLNEGSWSTLQNTGNLSREIEDKEDGSYDYRVQACNASGCSSYTSVKTVVVLHIPGVPGSLNISVNEYRGEPVFIDRRDVVWLITRSPGKTTDMEVSG